eukprot:TRINITY_DN2840_c0_g1_i1.p1 TRINITY_DN2840_c0_g1~~TRINITY_DN2840_c0_g1_i1.p1  ORF type:complete len:608 (+),score=159.46 TRINITY_DN2840_c0_g1_i1:68-1891(+)
MFIAAGGDPEAKLGADRVLPAADSDADSAHGSDGSDSDAEGDELPSQLGWTSPTTEKSTEGKPSPAVESAVDDMEADVRKRTKTPYDRQVSSCPAAWPTMLADDQGLHDAVTSLLSAPQTMSTVNARQLIGINPQSEEAKDAGPEPAETQPEPAAACPPCSIDAQQLSVAAGVMSGVPPLSTPDGDDDVELPTGERMPLQVQSSPPCEHNSWERVLKKKHSVTLRCRVCRKSWKTRLCLFSKCEDFYRGKCERGQRCPHPHIYSKCTERQLQLRRERVEKELLSESVDLWRAREAVPIRRQPDFGSSPAPGAHMLLRRGEPFAVTERRAEGDVQFLRLADGRGWAYDRLPGSDTIACENLGSDAAVDLHEMITPQQPLPAAEPTPQPAQQQAAYSPGAASPAQSMPQMRRSSQPRQHQQQLKPRHHRGHEFGEEEVHVRKDTCDSLGLDLSTNLQVVGVAAGSPAERAGLRRVLGRRLVKVNGERFEDSNTASIAIRHSRDCVLTFVPNDQARQHPPAARGQRPQDAMPVQTMPPSVQCPPQPGMGSPFYYMPQAMPPPQQLGCPLVLLPGREAQQPLVWPTWQLQQQQMQEAAVAAGIYADRPYNG